jgi:hypothetical protein
MLLYVYYWEGMSKSLTRVAKSASGYEQVRSKKGFENTAENDFIDNNVFVILPVWGCSFFGEEIKVQNKYCYRHDLVCLTLLGNTIIFNLDRRV